MYVTKHSQYLWFWRFCSSYYLELHVLISWLLGFIICANCVRTCLFPILDKFGCDIYIYIYIYILYIYILYIYILYIYIYNIYIYIYCDELFFMLSCRSLSMWHILLCVICGKCAWIVLPDFVMLHFYC